MRTTLLFIFFLLSIALADNAELSFTLSSQTDMITVMATFNATGNFWCKALPTSSAAPSVEVLKESTFTSEIEQNVETPLVIDQLSPSTSYDVYCYAEESDGTAMASSISDIKQTISTQAPPAELHLSFSLTGTSDSIDVHATVTASATVYCKAYSGSPDTPTAEDLKNEGSSKPFEANVENILALTGLEANTDYAVYCYAEDAEGQAMLETIASLKQTITTEPSASVTLSFTVSAKPTSITASVTLSASGTVYCSALTNPSSAPSDSELKESEFKKNVAASIADSIEITGLEANTSYDVYCYGETEDGTPMSETIEELKKTVSTSESAPVLTTSAGTPSVHSASIKVTLSSDGSVWCGVFATSSPAPSAEDIMTQSYIQVKKEEETVLDIYGLLSETTYHMFCYAKSTSDTPMETSIESTHVEISTSAYVAHDCGFGVYDPSTESCQCSSGFKEVEGKCTDEFYTEIFIIKIQGEADFSTPEKKAAYLTTVASDVSTALSISNERVMCFDGMPKPTTLGCAIFSNALYPEEITDLHAMQLLYKQLHTPESPLFSGNITKDIDPSLDLPHASRYLQTTSFSWSPIEFSKVLTSADLTSQYQEQVTISVTKEMGYIDQIEYGYDQPWYNGVSNPMVIQKDQTVSSTISLDTNKMENGVNAGYIRYMSDVYQDSFYLPLFYYKTNATDACSILDGKTGFDLLLAYTTLPFFYPGLITGVVIIALVFAIIICCICSKRAQKNKATKAGYMSERKIAKPAIQATNKNVKKSRV